jgi:seryl-tRNA synthetase
MTSAAAEHYAAFLDELVDGGLLIPSGVDGVFGRGEVLERIRTGFEQFFAAQVVMSGDYEQLRFPPLIPRRLLDDYGYLQSFPQLAAGIHAFEPDGDGGLVERATDLVLCPAACYPVYPAVAARGPLPAGGIAVDAGGAYVFRHEPSPDPARMQMFHQRELVRLGEATTVRAWRDARLESGLEILQSLGLDARREIASDPFFGHGGRLLAASQREQELKLELVVQIAGAEPTAVASFNYHQDHFGVACGLETADGAAAHSACVGFGEERIALALLRTHGLDPKTWPSSVRECLWPLR